jgi:hypothetical protein
MYYSFYRSEVGSARWQQGCHRYRGIILSAGEHPAILQPASSKTLLETWDTSLPLLQELADSLATNGATRTAEIPKEAAHVLAPVLYPDCCSPRDQTHGDYWTQVILSGVI